MDNFYFWKNWTKEYKTFFAFSFLLLIASSLFLIVSSLSGIDFIQGWGSIQELTSIPIDFQKFTNHYHEFKIETINYLIYEKYTSTLVEFNPIIGAIYISIVFIGFTLFLTFSTTLSKYLYYISVLVSLVFLATLNLDLLEIFESSNKQILTTCVIVFGGVSYAIYNFYYTLSLSKRFFIFASLNILLLVFCFAFSPYESQAIYYHFAGYSSASMLVLIAFFILYISIENSLFLLFLNSNNKKGSLPIYLLINVLYLGVFVAKLFFFIDIPGFNVYTLTISATLLTVWGTLKRNGDNKQGDTVARVLVIMVLGSLVLSTIAFHSANQNSPLIDGLKKVVFISFLGYGAIFLFYTLLNFIGHIHSKMNVYKFIFQPIDFTVFRLYMIGGIACMALFSYKYQKKPYYLALAAYYNSVADSYYIKDDIQLAEPFYEYAKSNAAYNDRSNVILANLSLKKNDLDKAIEHYKYAIITGGNAQAFIQLSNIYNQQGNYFDALFTLKEGLTKFPESYRLWNNLGILSKRSSLTDSTVHYFSKSIEYAPENDLNPVNNLITFLLKKDFNEEGKELIESIEEENQDLKTKAAIAAYNARNGILNQWNKITFEVDSNLSNEELAYLHNHFINNISKMDTYDLKIIDKTLDAPNNIFNYEQLTILKAFYEFYNGDPIVAKEHLSTLGSGTSFYSGYFNNLLGLWMLMHENYALSNKYLTISDKYNFQGGKFNHAFTESILGNKVAADTIWNQLGTAGIGYKNAISNSTDSLSDFHKLFVLSLGNQTKYEEFLNSCSDQKIKNLMKVERIKFLLKSEEVETAELLFDEIKSSEDIMLEYPLQMINAELNIKNENYTEALQVLSETNFPIEMKAQHLNLSATASVKTGDSTQAKEIYKVLVKRYPYYEEGLVNYSKYLSDKGEYDKAYNISVNGVKALPNSIELNKIYILLCLEEGLTDYADESLVDLKKLTNENDFNDFKVKYDQKFAKLEAEFDSWGE